MNFQPPIVLAPKLWENGKCHLFIFIFVLPNPINSLTRIGFKLFILVFNDSQARAGLELEAFYYFANFLRGIRNGKWKRSRETPRSLELWQRRAAGMLS